MKKKQIAKAIIFLALGLAIVGWLRIVLTFPASNPAMELAYRYRNQYDIIEIGPSQVLYNINNQQLYEQYGITGLSLGQGGQLMSLSQVTLLDVLEVQTPKLVILSAKGLFYNEDLLDKCYKDLSYLHYSFDRLHSFKAQAEAYKIFSKHNETLSKWDFFSKLYYSHTNWKNISNMNFEYFNIINQKDINNTSYNGNAALYTVADGLKNDYQYCEELAHIPEDNEIAFAGIVDMCNDAGIDLLVTIDFPLVTYEERNAVEYLCEKYQIPYLNVMDCVEEIGLDYSLDLFDATHFNLSGTIKWTNYLGQYISENYDFSKSNGKSVCNLFEDQRKRLANEKQVMETKIRLIEAQNFDNYLAELLKLNKMEYSIFISIGFEGTYCLTENELDTLKELGLQADFKELLYKSYVAAIVNDEVNEEIEITEGKSALAEGTINGIEYEAASGGGNSTINPSIKIDNEEYAQAGKGFNIVVYNNSTEQVISSVFFDTGDMVNPNAERFTEVKTKVRQMETGINVWEETK